MNKYRVRYYYLATGMEGQADKYVVGDYLAETPEAAIERAIAEYYGGRDASWLRGCLSVKELAR